MKLRLETYMHAIVLILSAILILYISIDTINGTSFIDNREYMTVQLIVCIFFIADFFLGLSRATNRWQYFRRHLIFLLLSIPYLNIIQTFDLSLSDRLLYFIRIIPLSRGALALAIIVGYISRNKMTSIFLSYTAILVAMIYIASLMFFAQEQPFNPAVPDYWSALWWAWMDATTIGSNIYPVTVTGKILGVLLGAMGMILFPLFTVYLTSLITRYTRH